MLQVTHDRQIFYQIFFVLFHLIFFLTVFFSNAYLILLFFCVCVCFPPSLSNRRVHFFPPLLLFCFLCNLYLIVPCMQSNRLKVHPSLDKYLTDTYHIRYHELFNARTDANLSSAINLVKRMTLMDDPHVSSRHENLTNATDIISHSFVQACGIENAPPNANLKNVLRQSLTEAKFSESKIQDALSNYEDTLTVGQYQRSFENSHLFKCLGFSNIRHFKAFLTEGAEKVKASGVNRKTYELILTPRFLLNNIKNIESLSHEAPRRQFLKVLNQFHRLYTTGAFTPSVDLVARVGQQGLALLATIRDNVSAVVQSTLDNERKGIKTLSLVEYSKDEEGFKSVLVNAKSAHKIEKLIDTTTSLDVDTDNQHVNALCFFTCFKCPTHSDISDCEIQDTSPIVDSSIASFNVFRCFPLTTFSEAEAHIQAFHSCTPQGLSVKSDHAQLFLCPLCDEELIPYALTCCVDHLEVLDLFLVSFFLKRKGVWGGVVRACVCKKVIRKPRAVFLFFPNFN